MQHFDLRNVASESPISLRHAFDPVPPCANGNMELHLKQASKAAS
jgi:hypothetical protein